MKRLVWPCVVLFGLSCLGARGRLKNQECCHAFRKAREASARLAGAGLFSPDCAFAWQPATNTGLLVPLQPLQVSIPKGGLQPGGFPFIPSSASSSQTKPPIQARWFLKIRFKSASQCKPNHQSKVLGEAARKRCACRSVDFLHQAVDVTRPGLAALTRKPRAGRVAWLRARRFYWMVAKSASRTTIRTGI